MILIISSINYYYYYSSEADRGPGLHPKRSQTTKGNLGLNPTPGRRNRGEARSRRLDPDHDPVLKEKASPTKARGRDQGRGHRKIVIKKFPRR